MATTTHRGACHCGTVRFRADLDLAEIETSRCNCSICLKGRFWKAVIPAEAFALEAGDEALATYRFGEGKIDHRFCTTCGVKTFGRVTLDGSDFVAINVACLEGVSDAEWAGLRLIYQDGREDDYDHAPDRTGFL